MRVLWRVGPVIAAIILAALLRPMRSVATENLHPADPIPDLLKAVNDASGKAFALWFTFLSIMLYLAIAIATTTHLQLLLEAPVKLPLLNVDLPLVAFYDSGPPLFLIIHIYVLTQLYLLTRSLYLFDAEPRNTGFDRGGSRTHPQPAR